MSEEQGQAQEQPDTSVQELAQQAAGRILASEEPQETPQETPPEETPQETQETQETQEEIRRHKLVVKAEGGADEEVEVDDSELKSGYMRQRDYQRKTAELAREREAAREQIKAQVEPVVSQYQQNLQYFEKAVWQALAPELQNTDWNRLAQENPAEWAQKMQAVTNVQNVLTTIQKEQEILGQKSAQEKQQALQKQIHESRRVLSEEIPGWNDQLYQTVLKTGLDYGWSPEELNAVTDARAIKVLHDAMKYRALQAAKPQVEKKVVNVPKVAKPGSAEKPDPNRENLTKAKAQLKKTGRTDDAVALARFFV